MLDEIQVRLIEIDQGTSNTILCESKPEWDEKAILFDSYLDGIEAKMVLRIVNEEIRNLEELTGADSKSIYLYDEVQNMLTPYDDFGKDLNLSNFIEDDKISFLKVPVIEPSISVWFDDLISILEDWDEAFSKIESDISTHIYIFSKHMSSLFYHEGIIFQDEILIGSLLFDKFCSQFNSDKYNGTKVEKIEKLVSHKNKLGSVLLINKNYRVGYDKYAWIYSKDYKIQKIYNKNIYLSKMGVVIPYIANIINLGDIIINLCHQEIIPNLARDNVNENSLVESIGFALGRGIHLYVLDNEKLNDETKELLRAFINRYYGAENTFIKSN